MQRKFVGHTPNQRSSAAANSGLPLDTSNIASDERLRHRASHSSPEISPTVQANRCPWVLSPRSGPALRVKRVGVRIGLVLGNFGHAAPFRKMHGRCGDHRSAAAMCEWPLRDVGSFRRGTLSGRAAPFRSCRPGPSPGAFPPAGAWRATVPADRAAQQVARKSDIVRR